MPNNILFNDAESLKQFQKKYNISEHDFKQLCQNLDNLNSLYSAFENKKEEYSTCLKEISSYFEDSQYIHSIRPRVKDSEHFIEKVIRKNKKIMEEKGDFITAENYENHITDLMGLRLLLLFKEDWEPVNTLITQKYSKDFFEPPFAYIRDGDDESIYAGIRIEKKDTYRSIHYVIKTKCGGCLEIQVRTLNEEAWGEIDHKLRYPYNLKGKMLSNYMGIMNRLVGTFDEMGTFVNKYINSFSDGVRSDYTEIAEIFELAEKISEPELKEQIQKKLKSLTHYKDSERFLDFIEELFMDLQK